MMRDQSSKAEIVKMWESFRSKYPHTKTTFVEWLNRGRVYIEIKTGGSK